MRTVPSSTLSFPLRLAPRGLPKRRPPYLSALKQDLTACVQLATMKAVGEVARLIAVIKLTVAALINVTSVAFSAQYAARSLAVAARPVEPAAPMPAAGAVSQFAFVLLVLQ